MSPDVKAACPQTWSPEDAEHLLYAEYLARFQGLDCCNFNFAWPVPADRLRPMLLAGFHNCLSFKPGCRFIGSFVITDSAANLTHRESPHAVFVFVKD